MLMRVQKPRSHVARGFKILLPLSAALMTSACAQSGLNLGSMELAGQSNTSGMETGSIFSGNPENTSGRPATASLGASAEAIAKARGLREKGQKARALATLDKVAESAPDDLDLDRERGLLALELGQLEKAETHLRRATAVDKPDWQVHSALGSALSASGRQSEAQMEFAKALQMAPDHPSILNNLALSYALDGKRKEAEKLLRQSATSQGAKPVAKQNLALILGLDGRSDEARMIGESTLPAAKAQANVSYLEQQRAKSKKVSAASPSPKTGAQTALNQR